MSGLDELPKAKWGTSGKQPIIKQDFIDIETAILQLAGRQAYVPTLTRIDNTAVRATASNDMPLEVSMSGFPNVLHYGAMIGAGLVDGVTRTNTSNVDMDFDSPSTFWGTEKTNQWYAVYAIAGDNDSSFTLKGMPWMRVSSQSTLTIYLRNSYNTGNIGYGFTTNEFVGSKILMVTGNSKGLIRTISANNNDNGTGGSVTYTGSALSVSQGDWFIILPNTNFRWLFDIFNDWAGHIQNFKRVGDMVIWERTLSGICYLPDLGPPLASTVTVSESGWSYSVPWVEMRYDSVIVPLANLTTYWYRYPAGILG